MRDFYGRPRVGTELNSMDAPKPYHKVAVVSGQTTVAYTRFEDAGDNACAIWRETTTKDTSGNVLEYKHEYAWDKWANRTSAVYVPINECWTL